MKAKRHANKSGFQMCLLLHEKEYKIYCIQNCNVDLLQMFLLCFFYVLNL